MLIVDDWRRWVTGNSAACDLLGVAPEEIAWHTLDEFTSSAELTRLDNQWAEFLVSGAIEGWIELAVASGGPTPVEFSATANWLPARHLAVFVPSDADDGRDDFVKIRATPWKGAPGDAPSLTPREREVMTLVAAGLHTAELAEHLVLSPETVKSHVQNAMAKLGAHTRAHAVTIALISGQISSDA